jgi:predicted nucleotidyltransferase
MNDALLTIQKLIKERYENAKAVFWAGSVAANQGTDLSDLDLVIVFESLPNAYREAFIYDSWPIDAFIHDLSTLRYFCGKLEASDDKRALMNMILTDREILKPNEFSSQAKNIAEQALARGPDSWTQAQIDKERFLITDILDDIKSPKNKEEQIISAVHLFEPLLQFYFRAQKKWAASGKSLIRLFKQDNPELAEEWTTAFEILIQTGDASGIESAVTKILAPHGGYLWDGFRSDAPAEWKVFKTPTLIENNTTIIYLTGKPGVGKYTIAKELAEKHGFIVCDNQLINNPIFELLQYDGYGKIPDFSWEAIGNIGRCISTFLIKERHNSYVLTNNLYEDAGDKVRYAEVVYMAEARGSIFVPVRLLIDQDEHLRRVVNPNRRDRWKSIDPQDVYDETPLLSISHPNLFSLNVSNLSPEDAAEAIMNHIKSLLREKA